MSLALLAALILLAACTNLGTLFASRAADRSKEIALRLALGSTRVRVVRQLLTEAILVSCAGGVVGLACGAFVANRVSEWRPVPAFPAGIPAQPDICTYIFALVAALVSALLFGLVPVRQVLAADPHQVLKTATAGRMRFRRLTLRDTMLAAQIAMCAVLITASLVATRGLIRALKSDFGFVPQNVTLATTELSMAGYKGEQAAIVRDRMLQAARSVPGVAEAAYADRLPLSLNSNSSVVFRDGATDFKMSKAAAEAMVYHVSLGYFSAARTVLLAGREIDWRDYKAGTPVAVVNEELARRVFGAANKAIGAYFRTLGRRYEIVGIARDGKYEALTEAPKAAMFVSASQSSANEMCLIVRSKLESGELTRALEKALHAVDPGIPLTIHSWDRELDTALFAARAATMALGVLGAIAIALAITGVFGMAAYSVSKRLRALGIRIALGADRTRVLSAALGRACRLLVYGSIAGLFLGMAATRLLAFIVYQATPRDPLVLAGVTLTMLLIGLIATWIPAHRAVSCNPVNLLREE